MLINHSVLCKLTLVLFLTYMIILLAILGKLLFRFWNILCSNETRTASPIFKRIAKDGKSFPYQPQLGSIIGVATQAKIISLHCMVILDLELVRKTPKTALLFIEWSFLIFNWCQKLLTVTLLLSSLYGHFRSWTGAKNS